MLDTAIWADDESAPPPERVLAGCSYGGDCPGVSVLPDGSVAVTGALPDGTEVTVTLPAGVFDEAARAWLALPAGGERRG